jgi:hypothetical protein
MNDRQLVGTAFEYANIQMLSTRIANDLEHLIQYAHMYEMPTAEIKTMLDCVLQVKNYSFTYTADKLIKEHNNK